MSDKQVLIFDIKSDFGHFRKYNTTTSPLTYPIPTRTAAVGIVGAILGIERELRYNDYPDGFVPLQERFNKQQAHIAIKIMRPIKIINQGFNLINTKDTWYDLTKRKNKNPHTQINFQLLKDPYYRFYVSLEDSSSFGELVERVKHKTPVYTPALGLAQFIAEIEFVDLKQAIYKENPDGRYVDVVSAVNMKYLYPQEPVAFDNNSFYSVNSMPMEMNGARIVSEYSDVLVERQAKPLKVKPKFYYYVENHGNIIFL